MHYNYTIKDCTKGNKVHINFISLTTIVTLTSWLAGKRNGGLFVNFYFWGQHVNNGVKSVMDEVGPGDKTNILPQWEMFCAVFNQLFFCAVSYIRGVLPHNESWGFPFVFLQ